MANVANMLNVDSLFCEGNCRSKACERIPEMVASLQLNGFKANHPLVVSEKTDGRYLVLVGNRRTLGLFFLRDNDPEAYKRALIGGKIPAIVHKDLTTEEETLIRIDHSTAEDRVPLDEWSIYLAIKQLVQIGMDTQEKIAEKLGLFYVKGKNIGKPNRSIVQPRANLVKLPAYVEIEMEKHCADPDSSNIRWPHIGRLFTAFNREFIEHPDADGPEFTELWESIMSPPEVVEGEPPTDRKKDLTPSDAVKRAQAASSKGVSRVLMAVTGQSEDNLATIDAIIVEGETAIALLVKIREYLGNDGYQQMLDHMAGEPVPV